MVKFQEVRTAKPECSTVEVPVLEPASAGRKVELPAVLVAGQREWPAVVAVFAAADLRSNVV